MKPLEPDVKQVCIGIVRGHERRTREYRKQYLEILYGGSCPDGQPKGNRTSTPTEDRAGRLMQLEASPEAARIRAVEDAVREIGGDIADSEVRRRLAQAILLNCSSGRDYPFELLNLTEFSRMDFYRRRGRFLCRLASNLHL